MIPPIVTDTGGLLRALACTADSKPTFPEYENVLTSASLIIVPALVLAGKPLPPPTSGKDYANKMLNVA